MPQSGPPRPHPEAAAQPLNMTEAPLITLMPKRGGERARPSETRYVAFVFLHRGIQLIGCASGNFQAPSRISRLGRKSRAV
jgi:hypothetical protein